MVLFLYLKKNHMNEKQKNPLGLEIKQYTIEEFGAAIRRKFGADKTVSDFMLGEMFISTYPVYSCNIKKSKNHISQKSCGCC
tara:strand:- start:622 stop:867 length:246 start_codon:yes stop_codon:yes gene_type:complete